MSDHSSINPPSRDSSPTGSLAAFPTAALRVRVTGIVQGVGFRPFVYRLANQHGLQGWVRNGAAGVDIFVEGTGRQLTQFLQELQQTPPPAALIDQVHHVAAAPTGATAFQILGSSHDGPPTVRVSPDLCVCACCARELLDPRDFRFGYPYINCTDCGPRYSIVRQLPYDRPATTMADWPLCTRCATQYNDPADRRYHAQPIACSSCGPDYTWHDATSDAQRRGESAMRAAVAALRGGQIVAIKGIGGYHLACDAQNSATVLALRQRKFRKDKPFAVMVPSVDVARRWVELGAAHEALLTHIGRPIVIAPARQPLPGVAVGEPTLGVMLPYAPLHVLLFAQGAPCPLVLTSGNRSSEPIAFEDDDAQQRLAGIADGFLVGERPIARRVDDSVVTVHGDRPQMLRRSRGFSPAAVATVPDTRPLLAVGADLKNSVALALEGHVVVSQYIGDLGDHSTETAWRQTVDDLLTMYQVRPEALVVIHDQHPEYRSTWLAGQLACGQRLAVQHHRAHIASVIAEHALWETPVLGVAWDGTGYGDDGAIWGGEIFAGSLERGLQRVTSWNPFALPGGDAAAQWPVQAAAGLLTYWPDAPDWHAPPFSFPSRFRHAQQLVERGVRCFSTTSVGRLFDAVAALLGFTQAVTYEGQAAIWLENQARTAGAVAAYENAPHTLDPQPILRAIVADRLEGRPIPEIAAAFHATMLETLWQQLVRLRPQFPASHLVVSGGVFQNGLLLANLAARCQSSQLWTLVTNEQVPPNDGGICLGQIALAAASP